MAPGIGKVWTYVAIIILRYSPNLETKKLSYSGTERCMRVLQIKLQRELRLPKISKSDKRAYADPPGFNTEVARYLRGIEPLLTYILEDLIPDKLLCDFY